MQVVEEERMPRCPGCGKGCVSQVCRSLHRKMTFMPQSQKQSKGCGTEERDPALRTDLEQTEAACGVPQMCREAGGKGRGRMNVWVPPSIDKKQRG